MGDPHNSDESDSMAFDELKLVQDAIFKQESYSYDAFKYAFVLITGLIVALLKDGVSLSIYQFLSFAFIVFIRFFYIQLIYRESFYGAVGRSHWLQKYLRKEITTEYNGPRIYESLHKLNFLRTP